MCFVILTAIVVVALGFITLFAGAATAVVNDVYDDCGTSKEGDYSAQAGYPCQSCITYTITCVAPGKPGYDPDCTPSTGYLDCTGKEETKQGLSQLMGTLYAFIACYILALIFNCLSCIYGKALHDSPSMYINTMIASPTGMAMQQVQPYVGQVQPYPGQPTGQPVVMAGQPVVYAGQPVMAQQVNF